MLKIFPIIALFVITSLAGYSQSLDAGFQLGTGFYSMSGLKSINNEVVRSLQFDSEIVSDFPPYFAYRPFILFNFGSYKFGIRYTFNSTGSRVSSKDYSGEYRFDMKIRSHSPELIGEIELETFGIFRLFFYNSFGIILSDLDQNEELEILGDMVAGGRYKYKSFSPVGESGFTGVLPFSKFDAEVSLGYLYQVGYGDYKSQTQPGMILGDPDTGKKISRGWNGFRAGVSLVYHFKI